jgi:hypothetical protein
MSEAWRNGYDAWKLSGPPEDEDERTDEEREQDEARAESMAEDRYMEEHFDRKYGHAG